MTEAPPDRPGEDAPFAYEGARIPAGYKDENDFVAEARKRFQEAADADRENRDAALDDLEFLTGNQWDAAAMRARKGRPCLTFNQLPQFVTQVVGDIRTNKPAIKVRPADDTDVKFAEVREGLIRAIERDSDAQSVYISAGQQQVSCGIGAFRVGLKYATNEAFDRDIHVGQVLDPLSVLWDPFLIDPTGRDARYVFVPEDIPKREFEARYPDIPPPEGEVLSHCQRDGWYSADSVRVTEYWLRKETPVRLALMQDGTTIELKGKDIPEGVQMRANGKPYVRDTYKTSFCMYLLAGFALIDGPYEYPISRPPLIRVPGWEVYIGKRRVRWGLIRFAKDPARLKNYWRSVSAEVLALAPRQQWLVHESMEGQADEFRKAHKSGETVLTWKGGNPPVRVEPPIPNAAVLQEAALNAQDIKDITGLHDASLGAQSNETSGKAIMARQREGDIANYIYQDNLEAGIREAGRVINELIGVVYDTARTIVTVKVDGSVTPQRINDPNHPQSIDITAGKFDITVDVGPSYTTKRVEAAESMMAFMQAVPQAGAAIADLVAKSQDWPMADEIAERLRDAMPPGLIKPDPNAPPEPPNPQQQAQMQAAQQAQQMQMQAAGLDLQLKQAMVRKAEADATNSQAVAALSEFQAFQAGAAHQLDQQMGYGASDRIAAEIASSAKPQPTATDPRLANAQASKAEADAINAHVGAASAMADLHHQQPLDVAHSAVDLATKLNPPEADEGAESDQ